jgi:hypothetical protein
MNDKIKALIFDAEQAITFAREAVEEHDAAALATALRDARDKIIAALEATLPPVR